MIVLYWVVAGYLNNIVSYHALSPAHKPRLFVLPQLGCRLLWVQHLEHLPAVIVRLLGDGPRARDCARVQFARADNEGFPGRLAVYSAGEIPGLVGGRMRVTGRLVAVVSIERTRGDSSSYQRTRDSAELHRRREDDGRSALPEVVMGPEA